MRHYVYIFVRQDMSIEQQIVQTGHVTHQMGFYMSDYKGSDKQEVADPANTNFVLVGVRNEEALEAVEDILAAFDFEHTSFIETYPKPHKTAVATYPIKEPYKGVLKAFNLLKVS